MITYFIVLCCSVYTPFNEDNASSGGQTFLFALLNALIVVAIVVVMTIVLVCLFKYRCYKVSKLIEGECAFTHTCIRACIHTHMHTI